jgi:hypothetical protein
MKLKVKITGWSEGKRRSITRTIETPDFEPVERKFLNRTWTDSIFTQQDDWVNDNYESIIIPLAEEVYFWPIEGFVAIEPKVKVNKRQLVIEYAEVLLKDWSIEMKEIFLVSLTKQWPQIKKQSIENIFKIVFNTIDVSTAVSLKHLKDVTEILGGSQLEQKHLNSKI